MSLSEEKDLTAASEEEQAGEAVEDAATLKQALAEAREKAERYLANWQRTEADLINYRKRAEQEKSELADSVSAILALSLLPILDDLDRAFTSLPAELKGLTWVDGVRIIGHKLKTALEAQGLTEIEAAGQPFDPHLHEAVIYEEGGEKDMVKEAFQKGYKWRDRVIRPSSVVVGRGKEERVSEGPEGKEE